MSSDISSNQHGCDFCVIKRIERMCAGLRGTCTIWMPALVRPGRHRMSSRHFPATASAPPRSYRLH